MEEYTVKSDLSPVIAPPDAIHDFAMITPEWSDTSSNQGAPHNDSFSISSDPQSATIDLNTFLNMEAFNAGMVVNLPPSLPTYLTLLAETPPSSLSETVGTELQTYQ